MEKRLEACTNDDVPTIVAGDLNLDLRDPKDRSKFETGHPRLRTLLAASKHLWNQNEKYASVNKQRTFFQAQVSKINLADFSLKD